MKWIRRSTINPLIAKLKWEWLITFNYIDELENKLKKYDQFKFEEVIKEICKNLAIKERKDVVENIESILKFSQHIIMGLIEQLISMNIMVEGKVNIFKKTFQKYFISTFDFDGKINPLELDVFTNHTKEIWYNENKKPHKREELVNLIMKLYKSIKDNTFVLDDEMLLKCSGIIDIYCNYLSKNLIDINLELIKTKVKAICEKLQINKKYYTTLNKKEYPLIDLDKMTHVKKIYFLRWVNNSKYEKSLFQDVIIDLWNNKISDKNLDRIFQTSLLYYINKFKSSNGYYDFFSEEYKKRYLKSFFDTVNEYCEYLKINKSNTEVEPNQKEPQQEIVFPSIER
ncbi:6644_t:CDS:2 [Dentiscutata heterogama]|uniref:6644_t:CDS:1 n=1 Tax=Dentiscutata heterogama TaxID=1316150 RepID=A0ACA9LDI2_9GLOM|nr:6644_t:CDS:2 [Dentiscutata heterogama]